MPLKIKLLKKIAFFTNIFRQIKHNSPTKNKFEKPFRKKNYNIQIANDFFFFFVRHCHMAL